MTSEHSHDEAIASLLRFCNCPPGSAFYKVLEILLIENERLVAAATVIQRSDFHTQEEYWRLQERYDDKLKQFNQLYDYHCMYKDALESTQQRLRHTKAQVALKEAKVDASSAHQGVIKPELDHAHPVRSSRSAAALAATSQVPEEINGEGTTHRGVNLNFPYEKKAGWLNKMVAKLKEENRLLAELSDMQKKLIEKLWQEMACAHSLELALRQVKKEQLCRICGVDRD